MSPEESRTGAELQRDNRNDPAPVCLTEPAKGRDAFYTETVSLLLGREILARWFGTRSGPQNDNTDVVARVLLRRIPKRNHPLQINPPQR